MDILEILKTKSHNLHYLTKYYSFILRCYKHNTNINEYTENHHICPKSKDMFPEFKSLSEFKWNSIKLTYRQHIIAHIYLWKAYNTESQLRSILFTIGQHHVTKLNLKSVNTKLVESLKKELSNSRKGKFPGGYLLDGTPNVSQSTRIKLSKLKTDFYSIPENRIAQSIRTIGIKKSSTEKISNYSLNRSQKHKDSLKQKIKEAWALKKLNNDTKRIKAGVYVTPIGNFSCTEYSSYCKNPNKVFSIHHIKKNPKLNDSVIGKTPLQLGFFFISKQDSKFLQYCVDLNLEHPPEPNHPLSSELNDYLLRRTIHRIP